MTISQKLRADAMDWWYEMTSVDQNTFAYRFFTRSPMHLTGREIEQIYRHQNQID